MVSFCLFVVPFLRFSSLSWPSVCSFFRGSIRFWLYYTLLLIQDWSLVDSRWHLTVSTRILCSVTFESLMDYFKFTLAAWDHQSEEWWARDFYFHFLSPDSIHVFHFVSTITSLPILSRISPLPPKQHCNIVCLFMFFVSLSLSLSLWGEGAVNFIEEGCSVLGGLSWEMNSPAAKGLSSFCVLAGVGGPWFLIPWKPCKLWGQPSCCCSSLFIVTPGDELYICHWKQLQPQRWKNISQCWCHPGCPLMGPQMPASLPCWWQLSIGSMLGSLWAHGRHDSELCILLCACPRLWQHQ